MVTASGLCLVYMLLNYLHLGFAPPMHHMISVCSLLVQLLLVITCGTVQQRDVYVRFHETWPLHIGRVLLAICYDHAL